MDKEIYFCDMVINTFKKQLFIKEIKRLVQAGAVKVKEEVIEKYKNEIIVKRRGRWGIYYYTIQSQKGDYQKINKIACDSVEDVRSLINNKGIHE